MCEVIGRCVVVTAETIVIRDSDGDDIDMDGFLAPDQVQPFMAMFLNKYISFCYNRRGHQVRIIPEDEPLFWVTQHDDGEMHNVQVTKYGLETMAQK